MIAAALRSAIEKIPTREERLGGQTFKYVKLSEVLDLLDTFHNTPEPCEQLSPSAAASFDKTLARSPRRIPDWRSQESSEPQTPKEAPKPGVRCQVTYRGKQCCRPDGHEGEHIATGASANMRW